MSKLNNTNNKLLDVSDLSMRFGGLLAVNGVALTVKEKQVVALIGPNGAGKTTVFNCVSGFYRPTAGRIVLDGTEIAGRPGHRIARAGIVRTFQNIRLFRKMTAVENLLVAQHTRLDTNWFTGLFALPRFRRSERAAPSSSARPRRGPTIPTSPPTWRHGPRTLGSAPAPYLIAKHVNFDRAELGGMEENVAIGQCGNARDAAV